MDQALPCRSNKVVMHSTEREINVVTKRREISVCWSLSAKWQNKHQYARKASIQFQVFFNKYLQLCNILM
jgi:hypothetical protein